MSTGTCACARESVEQLVEKWKGEEGNLIMILHAIQNNYGYVPRELAMELARLLDVKLARIYEVITFYHYFKLQPPGKHEVSVCLGTACYLKGSQGILNELKNQLGVQEGQTTEDRSFQLGIVRCIGCCGMSPAMTVDGKTYGKVKTSDIGGILAEAKKGD
ncbi:MAG: NAD(P)H-dependent oxidoreductase subunit E [Verrucomicrobiota bacterium]